jgi:hypothetical protein
VFVAVQLLVVVYRPPVLKYTGPEAVPPQTIISLTPQTAVCCCRPVGAFMVLVAVQLSVLALYLPPVFKKLPFHPPQMIIWLPVETAV